ncbi:MAG: hypothetical protein ACKVQW_14910 [Pyrinomonadaceae bacterium]
MKAARISLTTIFFALLILVCAVATQISPKEQAQVEFTKWQRRVDDLTKEIAAESSAVPDSERAMYLALLAQMWWEVDQKDARVHLKAAADKTLGALRADDKSDLAKKVEFTQKTIKIITKLDETFALNLVGQIEKLADAGDVDNQKENPEMAELYANLGLQVAEKKPEIALACGFDSLIFGVATRLPALISELNIQDSAKAELLYGRAMAKMQGTYSRSSHLFLFGLGNYMFDVWGPKGFSTSMRRAFLNTYSDRVATAAQPGPERPTRCQIAYFAPSVLSRIDEYVPNQSLPFRQNIQTCTPYLAKEIQEMTQAKTGHEKPKTVDELVSAAKDSSDKHLKVNYWREALALLEKEKKYAETISLLDSTDGDDYKTTSPIGWDNWRGSAAFQAAYAAFEAKDLPTAYRVIEQTPKRIRPEVRMQLAKKLKPAGDNQFYMENLDEMRKELDSLEMLDKDVAGFYRTLAGLYLKVRPTDAEAMFRNAVKYINKADNDNPDFENDKDWAPFFDYVPMTSELLEADELSITSSLNNLSSRRSRVRLKLGFLESSLKKYVEAKKKLDELKKSRKPSSP